MLKKKLVIIGPWKEVKHALKDAGIAKRARYPRRYGSTDIRILPVEFLGEGGSVEEGRLILWAADLSITPPKMINETWFKGASFCFVYESQRTMCEDLLEIPLGGCHIVSDKEDLVNSLERIKYL